MCAESGRDIHLSVFPLFFLLKRLTFIVILTSDEDRRAAMKTRNHRNIHRLIIPVFGTPRQIEKAAMKIRRQRIRSAHRLIPPAFCSHRQNEKALMKIRRQRNTHRLMVSAFCVYRQLDKLNRLKHAGVTSPRIETDGHLVTDQVIVTRVDVEHIVIGSYCLFMSLCFIMLIVAGRD
jgi:hypothetical protein